MKEIIIVFRRSLFSNLLLSNKEDLEKICQSADKVVSHSDSILINFKNLKWKEWESDVYINLMSLISKLDSIQKEEDFHYLEWNEEFNHNEEFGSYFNNPWKTNLKNKYKEIESEKKFNLEIFF